MCAYKVGSFRNGVELQSEDNMKKERSVRAAKERLSLFKFESDPAHLLLFILAVTL